MVPPPIPHSRGAEATRGPACPSVCPTAGSGRPCRGGAGVSRLCPLPPRSTGRAMLKPGDPGGSAFLKVDPAYLQHWQQLFPQSSQLKSSGPLSQLQPPERAEPSADSLRQRPTSLSSASSSSSSSTPSSSSTSSCVAAAAASLAGLTSLPVTQLPVFGPLQSSELPAGGAPAPLQGKDLCGAGSGGGKCGDRGAARYRCTAEELDYYLYGQQRMEIIPLNQHTSDPNNRTYRAPSRSPPLRTLRVSPHGASPGTLQAGGPQLVPAPLSLPEEHPQSCPSLPLVFALLPVVSGDGRQPFSSSFSHLKTRSFPGRHASPERLWWG